MICPKCGFDNPSGSFCGNCGAPLAVQAVPAYQPPTSKPKSKKKLYIAIVAVVIVVAVVLAAMLVVLPKNDKSTTESAMASYFDGVKNKDAEKVIDSTIMHFDTANRSLLISSMESSWGTMSLNNVSIVSSEEMSSSSVPTDIKKDVANFTTDLQNRFHLTVQDSQFLKVTIKQTNSSTDSYTATTYTLFSKIDGNWYFDIYVSYTSADWAADRSMGDKGVSHFPGTVITTTPSGTFTAAMNSSGSWYFSVSSVSDSSLKYSECLVKLTVGTHVSTLTAIPSLMSVTIPVTAGNATGYTLTISDYGTSGYVSGGDLFVVGPFTSNGGLNAKQPSGTFITLALIDSTTAGTIAQVTWSV